MARAAARRYAGYAFTAALALLLVVLALKAGRQGLSNFFAQSAHLEIERLSEPGVAPRGNEAMRAMHYLAQSLQFAPDNAWTLEEMGSLQLRRRGASTEARLAAARSANVDFRLALVQRPASAFTWANLALSKFELGEADDELMQALARAQELGPWEPEVQQAVTFVGLGLWTRLKPAEQQAVLRTMERGARRDAAKIAAIAQAYQRSDLFCALRDNSAGGREICRQLGLRPATATGGAAGGKSAGKKSGDDGGGSR
jgi:hypothetical protein